MDYKEKYNAALERARHYYLTGKGEPVDFIKMIFPEIEESEDEKIRRELIEFLKLPHSQFVGNREHEKWIAWLEKQNPAWGEKDKNLLNRLIGVLDGTNEEDYHEAWEDKFLPWLKSLKQRIGG